jgi:hypothetical protein
MALDLIAKFSVIKIMEWGEAQKLFAPFLAPEEKIMLAYSHIRDGVAFTDKKIIAYDVQGFTGQKKEFRFFPYSKISSFSIETAGTFELDSDFKIWISGVVCFEIKFGPQLDINAVGSFLFDKVQ